jgi:hypothetical protein
MQQKPLTKSIALSLIKALMKLEIEGMYLNLIKVIYDKPMDKIILNGKKLRSGMR